MSNTRTVWTDKDGDIRKKDKAKKSGSDDVVINETKIELKVRRLTAGKGRTVIEITGLPNHKKWCQQLAKELKKSLGVGGTFKEGRIEVHGEKIDLVTKLLDSRNLTWKKTGG